MKSVAHNAEGLATPIPRGWRNRYRPLRRAVFGWLNRFHTGRLEITDPQQTHVVGDPQSELRAHVKVLDPAFYRRVALGASLGAAESYIRGEWTSPDLVAVVQVFARNQDVFTPFERRLVRLVRPIKRWRHRLRQNTKSKSKRNIVAHYDLGEDFYQLFLDPTMTYSSAVFSDPAMSLEEASKEKLDRLCRKLQLVPGHHLLEIGSGWGSLAVHAATHYGCRVTTTTISPRQFKYVSELVQAQGLRDRITVVQQDYRDLKGTYDRIISIEMIEAVGHEYVHEYLACCDRLLRPGGQMGLQAITIDDAVYEDYRKSVDFIQYYVFPGACLVSPAWLDVGLKSHTSMSATDTEDITAHYAETLARWRTAFLAQQEQVKNLGLSDSFIRLWEFYLCYCEAGFRERRIGDVQMILTKA